WSRRGTACAGAAGLVLPWFSASRSRFPPEAVRRSRTMISIKKILYPTDFSSYSNQAYFHAVALAENHGASLTVLFVHTPDFTAPDRPPDAAQRYWQSQLEQIRPLNPDIPVQHILLQRDPATAIVR